MADPRTNLTLDELPTKVAHRFGLKSVAETTQKPNGHWMTGSEWEEQCGTNLKVAPDNCDIALTQEERTKVSFTLDDGVGTDDFTLYGFHRCSAIGTALSARSGYAMAELSLGEWGQVERLFAQKVIDEGTTPIGDDTDDARAALGALLQAWPYPIEPTIHVTPNVATALASTVQNKVNHLETRTGEHISNGFGYGDALVPDETPVDPEDPPLPDVPFLADVSEGLIILTGPTFVHYGTAIENEQIDPPTNTYLALAERPYSIGYLCGAIYVKVTGLITL